MSFLKKYLELSHRYFFESLDAQGLSVEIEKTISEKDVAGKWIYLSHTEPVKFALSFLSLIDKGAHPICLSSSKGLSLDSWALLDGQWQCEVTARSSRETKPHYAVPTSGTTGAPKLCEFSFETAKMNALSHALGFSLETEQEIIQTLPVHHSYGVIAYIMTPLVVGCPVNFCPGMVGLRSLKKDKTPTDSVMHVSPSQARFILRDKVSMPQIKKLTIGGGAVTMDELQGLQAVLPEAEIFVSYGLTEAGPRVTAGLFHPGIKFNLSLSGNENWLGYAIKDVKLKLVEQDTSQTGRLCVSSPFIKKNVIAAEKDGEWLLTRDRVQIIEDHVFFLSREDDLLKYGGVTIYPKDIEAVVRRWPGVTDVIVLKENDPMYGDQPLLMIEGHISLENAQELMNEQVAAASAFKEIYIQEQFPRQSLEKVDRKKLLEIARSLKA